MQPPEFVDSVYATPRRPRAALFPQFTTLRVNELFPDMLCERWTKEPTPEGPAKGWEAEDYLEDLKSEYYDWHGWDSKSSPQKRSTLVELGMADVAEVLSNEGVLA